MAKFEVTPEMMNSIAKDIEQKIQEWNQSVKQIYELHKELDAQFDGTANTALNERMNMDLPKYEALSNLMTEYTAEIVKASADYIGADNDASVLIKQSM